MLHKYIVIHKAAEVYFTNGFIVSTNYSHSLDNFISMAAEAMESFEIKLNDIECRSVVRSGWCKGCPIIRFALPNGAFAEGWNLQYQKLPDICW